MKPLQKTIFITLILVATSQIIAAQAPTPRSKKEVQAVLAKAPKIDTANLKKLNVVLVANKKDHGENEHDYPVWQKCWQLLLGGTAQADPCQLQVNLYGTPAPFNIKGASNVNITLAKQWPSKQQFASSDLVVMFCHGSWNKQNTQELEQYLNNGGGFVAIHSAILTPKDANDFGPLQKFIGIAWEPNYSGYRHGPIDLKITAKDDPICLGLPDTISLIDEAYWPLRGDANKIRILATSDEKISKDSDQKKPEPMFWTYQYGKGRVFGCVLGHYNWTFDDPYFRIILLRGMAWAAKESPYRFDPIALSGTVLSE